MYRICEEVKYDRAYIYRSPNDTRTVVCTAFSRSDETDYTQRAFYSIASDEQMKKNTKKTRISATSTRKIIIMEYKIAKAVLANFTWQ